LGLLTEYENVQREVIVRIKQMYDMVLQLCKLALHYQPTTLIGYVDTLLSVGTTPEDANNLKQIKSSLLIEEQIRTEGENSITIELYCVGSIIKLIKENLQNGDYSESNLAAKQTATVSNFYSECYNFWNVIPKSNIKNVKKPWENMNLVQNLQEVTNLLLVIIKSGNLRVLSS